MTGANKKLIPDMSTPEGIEKAFEHLSEHSDERPHDLMRVVDLELLRILEEEGIEDAEVLEEELKRTASGSGLALYDGIRGVGDTYTQDQASAPQGDEHIDLKRIAGVAYAISAISSATLIGANGNSRNAIAIIENAQDGLSGIGTSEEAEAEKAILGGIMQSMIDVLPVAES